MIYTAFAIVVVAYFALRLKQKRINLTECDCSVHDITVPGASHANDCPDAGHND
jgi:hypothetical protein